MCNKCWDKYNKFLGHWVIKLIINDGGDGLTVVILWVCDRLSRGGGGGGEDKCGCADKPLRWSLRRFWCGKLFLIVRILHSWFMRMVEEPKIPGRGYTNQAGGMGARNPGYWGWRQGLALQSQAAWHLRLGLFLDVSNQIRNWKRSDRAEVPPEANYHHQKNRPLRPSVTQKRQAWGAGRQKTWKKTNVT